MIGTTLRLVLLGFVVVAAIAQLWRVRRFWAFLFLFIVLFPKIGVVPVPGNPTPVRLDDLVLAVVLGGWLIREALVGRREAIPASPITPFLLAYLVCAAVSTLLGIAALRVPALTGSLHFLRLVEFALLYYYFYRAIDPAELPAVKEVFLNTWLIVAGIWAIQHVIGSTMPVPGAIIDQTSYAPSFSASYDVGGYAMIATVMCYALWTDRQTRGWGITLGLLAGLYIVFNGDSRASFLGLALAIAFDLFLRLRVKVAAGLIAVALSVPYLISSEKMAHLFDLIGEVVTTMDTSAIQREFFNDPSIAIRLRNWQLALERWRESPLAGDGLGAYLEYVRIYNQQGTPDGWYIRMLAEVGLLGLLAFVMTIGCLLWVLLTAYRELDQPLSRAIVYAAALAVIATSTNALLIDTFVSYKIMGVFWMVMAAGTRVAASRPTTAEAGEPNDSPPLVPGLDPSPRGAM